MNNLRKIYPQIEGFLDFYESECNFTPPEPLKPTYTQLESHSDWLIDYRLPKYPACVNALASVNPTIETYFDETTHKFIIGWSLNKLSHTQRFLNDKLTDNEIQYLCDDIENMSILFGSKYAPSSA